MFEEVRKPGAPLGLGGYPPVEHDRDADHGRGPVG